MMTWDWDRLPTPDFYGDDKAKTELMENEEQRTYYFPGGDTVVLKNVVEVSPRASGTHRIKTASRGRVTLHIIPAGWIHIEIKTRSGKWSF